MLVRLASGGASLIQFLIIHWQTHQLQQLALLCQTAQLVQVAQMLTTNRTLLCTSGKERHEKS
jgi:hypothetical protein